MSSIDLQHTLSAAERAADKARALLQENFRHSIEIEKKGPGDFVTWLDKRCEDIIREELMGFDDSIEFFGEESTKVDVQGDEVVVDVPDTAWIVDPLDGTSNYIHGFEHYCVSISLRIDRNLSVSVIAAPSLNKTYTAIVNQGAYLHVGDKDPEQISTNDRGDEFTLFGTYIPFRTPEYLDPHMEILKKLFREFEDVRRTAGAELDLSSVADGAWGVYFSRFLRPWDTAAGALLVREAGGVISDWDGDDDKWLTSGKIVAAASPRLHDKMMTLIK